MTFNQSFILFSLIAVTLLLMYISSNNARLRITNLEARVETLETQTTTLQEKNISLAKAIGDLADAGVLQANAGLILYDEIKMLKERDL